MSKDESDGDNRAPVRCIHRRVLAGYTAGRKKKRMVCVHCGDEVQAEYEDRPLGVRIGLWPPTKPYPGGESECSG